MIKFQDFGWVLLRVFMGLVFAYAGYMKLLEPIENFRGALASYEVLPYALVPLLAHTVPWVELIFGVFMIAGYAVRPTALVLSFLALCFVLIIASSSAILERGFKDCGCFGQSGPIRLTVYQVFILDILNFFLGLKLFSIKRHLFSLDAWLGPAEADRPVQKSLPFGK